MAAIPSGPIIYSTGPNQLQPGLAQGLPMIQSIPDHDLGDYSSVPRPRHEISGTAYQDKTQPSGGTEIMGHATQTAEYNQSLAQQRHNRSSYLNDLWQRRHEPPPGQDQTVEGASISSVSQAQRSPQQSSAAAAASSQSLGSHATQPQHQMIGGGGYQQQQQMHSISQSPSRPMAQQLPGGGMHHRSPTMPMGVSGNAYGQPQYGGYQGMWTSGQGQPSQLVQAPMQQHPGQYMQQQPSPHIQPNAIHPAQLHSGSGGIPMGYNQVQGGMNPPGYGVPRQQQQIYQASPNPQHYMPQGQAATTQPGMGQWSQAPSGHHPAPQNWPNF